MPERKLKFMGIMKVELKDLQNDIMELVAKLAEEREDGRLSNYVYRENVVALENEIAGIKVAEAELEKVNPEKETDLDNLIKTVNERLDQIFKQKAINRASFVIIQRKIEKVRGYVTKDLHPEA